MQDKMVAQAYFMQDVRALLAAGRKLEAIQLLMRRTGASLKTCETILEQLKEVTLAEALPAAVRDLAAQGQRLEAGQLLKEHTGLPMASCLAVVEELNPQAAQASLAKPPGILGVSYTNGTLALIRYDAGEGERLVTPQDGEEWRRVLERYRPQLSDVSHKMRGLPWQEPAPPPPPRVEPVRQRRRLLPLAIGLLLLLGGALVALLWWLLSKAPG